MFVINININKDLFQAYMDHNNKSICSDRN